MDLRRRGGVTWRVDRRRTFWSNLLGGKRRSNQTFDRFRTKLEVDFLLLSANHRQVLRLSRANAGTTVHLDDLRSTRTSPIIILHLDDLLFPRYLSIITVISHAFVKILSDEQGFSICRIRCLTGFGNIWATQRKTVADAWARQSLVCCLWFLTRLDWESVQFPGSMSGATCCFSPSRTRRSLWHYRFPATAVSSFLRSFAPRWLVSLRCCFSLVFVWAQVRSSTTDFFLFVPFFTSSPPPRSFVL